MELTPVKDYHELPNAIHGTFYSCWNAIKEKGLHRMGRNHIHFAPGTIQEGCATIRANVDIYIYIDVKKALKDGIPFFKASNNVILSPGDKFGFIGPCYFSKVVNAKNGKQLQQ